MYKIDKAHIQYVNNHYTMFEYNGMKTVGVKFTQTRHPLGILDGKILSSTPFKNEKIFIKCAQNKRRTSSMCVNNHYVKFEYKDIKLELQITI